MLKFLGMALQKPGFAYVRIFADDADGKKVFGATKTEASGIDGVELFHSRAQREWERHNLVLSNSQPDSPARIAQ